ncbi:MAG: hypothetical protein ACE5LS_05375 [Thermoplasmata archaeon]
MKDDEICGGVCQTHDEACCIAYAPPGMKENQDSFNAIGFWIRDAADPHQHMHLNTHPSGMIVVHYYTELVDRYAAMKGGADGPR